MSPDQPFVLRGGKTEDAALHNRVAAIKRISYLSGGIDLSKKSADYLKALDLEMYVRWYKDEAVDKQIDETFCQRAAEVIKAMDGAPVEFKETAYNQMKAKNDQERSYLVNQHAQSGSEDVRIPLKQVED